MNLFFASAGPTCFGEVRVSNKTVAETLPARGVNFEKWDLYGVQNLGSVEKKMSVVHHSCLFFQVLRVAVSTSATRFRVFGTS